MGMQSNGERGGGNERQQPSVRGSSTFYESGKGYWMCGTAAMTLRCEGENRPSRPSNVVLVGLFDMMGGKPGCHYQMGAQPAPTLTRGRASVNDIHSIVMEVKR